MSNVTVEQEDLKEDLKKNVKNEMMIFSNPEFGKVRSVMINNEPWFVGKDVAEILGYKKPENALSVHVDKEDKTTTLIQGIGSNYKTTVTIINESGLYSLILSSKLPSAKEFKRWVTSEVLPSIRKHGIYATEELEDKILNNPDFLIKVLTELKEERKQKELLTEKNKEQRKEISKLKPKAEIADILTNVDDRLDMGQFCKVINKENGIKIGRNNLFKLLRSKRILCKNDNLQNLPMKRYQQNGYFEVKESYWVDPKTNKKHYCFSTYITPKGQEWLIKQLKKWWKDPDYVSYFDELPSI